MRSVLSVKEMLHIATMLNGRSSDVSCFVVVIVWSVLIEKKSVAFCHSADNGRTDGSDDVGSFFSVN